MAVAIMIAISSFAPHESLSPQPQEAVAKAAKKAPSRSETKDATIGKDDMPAPPWLAKSKGRRRS
jgi:hypothetical protein